MGPSVCEASAPNRTEMPCRMTRVSRFWCSVIDRTPWFCTQRLGRDRSALGDKTQLWLDFRKRRVFAQNGEGNARWIQFVVVVLLTSAHQPTSCCCKCKRFMMTLFEPETLVRIYLAAGSLLSQSIFLGIRWNCRCASNKLLWNCRSSSFNFWWFQAQRHPMMQSTEQV